MASVLQQQLPFKQVLQVVSVAFFDSKHGGDLNNAYNVYTTSVGVGVSAPRKLKMKEVAKSCGRYNNEEKAHELSSNLEPNGIIVGRFYSKTDQHGHFFYDDFDKYLLDARLSESEYKVILRDYVNALRYLHGQGWYVGIFEYDNLVIRGNRGYLFAISGHSLSDCAETEKNRLKSLDFKNLGLAIKRIGNHSRERLSFLNFLGTFGTPATLWKHPYFANHIDKLGYFETVHNALKGVDPVLYSEMDSEMVSALGSFVKWIVDADQDSELSQILRYDENSATQNGAIAYTAARVLDFVRFGRNCWAYAKRTYVSPLEHSKKLCAKLEALCPGFLVELHYLLYKNYFPIFDDQP